MQMADVTQDNASNMLEKHKKTFTSRMNWIIKQRPSSEAIWKKFPRYLDLAKQMVLNLSLLSSIETYFINLTDPE
jgi:hypothetical protein